MDPELAKRFPNMKPLKGTPALGSLNGFGLSMYGRRAFDQETGTYIATHYIILLFVPVFALGSYRVADAEGGGWYFVGKEDVSSLWKTLNTATLSLVVYLIGTIWWASHTSSPDYRQREAIEQAAEMHEDGELYNAMTELNKVRGIGGNEEARILELIKQYAMEGVTKGNWKQASNSMRFILSNRLLFKDDNSFQTNLVDASLDRVATVDTDDREQAHEYLGNCLKFFGKSEDVDVSELKAKDVELLESLASDKGAPIKYAVSLAEHYEQQENVKRCKELLQSRIKELGQTEGARILGQILVGEGDFATAYPLLSGYVTPKLGLLKKASEDYTKAADLSYDRTIQFLNDGKASDSFYTKYEKANKAEQEQMVNEFAIARMERDSQYNRALATLRTAGDIVPVAMDLGILQLRQAQSAGSKEEQSKLLKDSEKTFLAIQGVAGDDVDYQLSLGQVYYWMGKIEEGEKLFAAARKSSGESYSMLYSQGSIYRELGDVKLAKSMMETAYKKAKDDEQRHSVASMIAPMCEDSEEEIEWLEKCDTNEVGVKVGISNAKGEIAYGEGDLAGAEKHFLQAVKYYKQLPKSAVYLNNQSLVLQHLYGITSKASYYKEAVKLMNEAVKLNSNNSITVNNAVSLALRSALIDLLSEKYSPEFAKKMSSMNSLRLFYQDAGGRAAIRKKFLANKSAQQAFRQLGSLRILSPKSSWVHSSGASWYWMMDMDEDALDIYQKMGAISWSHDDEWKQDQKDIIDGKRDQDWVDALAQREITFADARKKITNEDEWLLYQVNGTSTLLGAASFGCDVDLASAVAFTKKAFEKLPSSFTQQPYKDALLAKGLQDVASTNAEVKQFLNTYGKLIEDKYLFYHLTLQGGGKFKSQLIQNKQIQTYLKLERVSIKNFPQMVSYEDKAVWALLGDGAALPGKVTQGIYQQIQSTQAESSYKRYPHSTSSVLNYYWQLAFSGKTSEANMIYQKALKEGLMLPSLK